MKKTMFILAVAMVMVACGSGSNESTFDSTKVDLISDSASQIPDTTYSAPADTVVVSSVNL